MTVTRSVWSSWGGAAALLWVVGCANAGLPKKAWTRISVDDVQVYTPLPESRVHDLLIDFAKFRAVARPFTAKDAKPLPTKVFLFPDQHSFDTTLDSREFVGRYGMQDGIYYVAINVNSGPAAGRESLFHGYTYQLLRSSGRKYPSWYRTGMAELLSTAVFRDGGAEIGRIPDNMAAGVTSVGRWVSTEALLGGEVFKPDSTLEHRQFGHAQAWVGAYYFQLGPRAGTGDLERYLYLVNEGMDPVDAVGKAMDVDAEGLGSELRDLARVARFSYLTIPLEKFEYVPPSIEAHEMKLSATADQMVYLCWAIGCGDQAARLQEYGRQLRRESR